MYKFTMFYLKPLTKEWCCSQCSCNSSLVDRWCSNLGLTLITSKVINLNGLILSRNLEPHSMSFYQFLSISIVPWLTIYHQFPICLVSIYHDGTYKFLSFPMMEPHSIMFHHVPFFFPTMSWPLDHHFFRPWDPIPVFSVAPGGSYLWLLRNGWRELFKHP